MIKDRVIEMLTSLDVLKSFSTNEINEKFFRKGLAKIVQYEPGETIIKEGLYDNWVFWLMEGKVDVIKNGVTIASFQRIGDMFGEMGILDGNARTATVAASTFTVCFELDMSIIEHSDLKNKISKESFCRSIAQLTKDRLAKTTRRLSDSENELTATKRRLAEIEQKWQSLQITVQKLLEKNAEKDKKIDSLMADLEAKEKELLRSR